MSSFGATALFEATVRAWRDEVILAARDWLLGG